MVFLLRSSTHAAVSHPSRLLSVASSIRQLQTWTSARPCPNCGSDRTPCQALKIVSPTGNTRTNQRTFATNPPSHPSANAKLNPPLSTLPPPLSTPSRDGLPAYKYYFRLGKAYVGFYKAGLRAIYANYNLATKLPLRPFSPSGDIESAVRGGSLTRADYQLLLRVRNDVRRIPLFALVFCICGEFTPLVVLAVSGVVPRTLWIPKQVQRAREKARERGRRSEAALNEDGASKPKNTVLLPGSEETRHFARVTGLYPEWMERFVPRTLSKRIVEGRMSRTLKELAIDDFAISRDGGILGLVEEEVRWACDMRGLDALDSEMNARSQLKAWLLRSKKGPLQMPIAMS